MMFMIVKKAKKSNKFHNLKYDTVKYKAKENLILYSLRNDVFCGKFDKQAKH